ncbi:hypothetical protein [Roseobacter sinensis]|uniref:Uncharacterized protein n=1 Tax=Roseobacter sinensis TaxID=2931391 RepID=A0ABT3BGZ9_9RHOB|nr:hypothetical protein [Roseobacter sp. WL0113]MCV3272848.1 hypothetical protein [Roseobacter sp. WL0113]
MQHRPVPDVSQKPVRPCRIEILQSALHSLVAPDHRLEALLDRIEARP